MADIEIFQKNAATVTIQCNHIVTGELKRYLSAKAPNYRFHPKYKAGYWDGNIYALNANNEMAVGLIDRVYEFARLGKYSVECKFQRKNEISLEDFKKFVDSLQITNEEGERIEPRDFQLQAAYDACVKKTLNIHVSTSGGKSLILYIVCRFMQYLNLKTLLITPQTQLVEQMFGDFKDYGWDVQKHCHRIYSGQTKLFNSPVIISCWQSLQGFLDANKNKKNLFDEFDCIIVDECHTGKAKTIQEISNRSVNAEYRIGCSGTYPELASADWLAIVGAFGPIKTYATYQMLQAKGYISGINIYSMILDYDKEFKVDVYNSCQKNYAKENAMVLGNPKRNEFLLNMVSKLNENCLVLFTNKSNHGYLLKELFRQELTGRILLYIDGDTPVEVREEYRKIMENNSNVVLLATYGTLSAGTNIKNLVHIIFASGYKSKIKVLQSIGRGLRKHKNKINMKLYDLVDNISFTDKRNSIHFINYAMKHAKERNKIYIDQGWDIKEIKFKL